VSSLYSVISNAHISRSNNYCMTHVYSSWSHRFAVSSAARVNECSFGVYLSYGVASLIWATWLILHIKFISMTYQIYRDEPLGVRGWKIWRLCSESVFRERSTWRSVLWMTIGQICMYGEWILALSTLHHSWECVLCLVCSLPNIRGFKKVLFQVYCWGPAFTGESRECGI